MTDRKTLLGAAAFSAALAGGGVAGALLGTPAVSGAQDESTTTTEVGADDTARPFRAHRGALLEAAAEALGMTPEELRAELADGRSIAQVAEERDVELSVVVDALVADGTERLEAAIAALPERVGDLVEREGLPARGHRHGDRGMRPSHAPDGDADADAGASASADES